MENRQIVVFKLMGHEFGMDITKVLEILNYEEVRPVPNVAHYVEGIINVRGTVYPIFNLRKRLNMKPIEDTSDTKFILLHLDNVRIGFLVDGVSEILTVDEEQVEKAPQMIDKNKSRNKNNTIDYIIKQEDRMVIVLNVESLISEEENLFIQGVSDEKDSGGNSK